MQRCTLFLLDILSRILALLPRRGVRFLGSLLGYLWIDILQIRRKVIQQNLDIAFPDVENSQKMRWGRNSVHKLGADFAEVLTTPFMDQNWLQKNVVFEGLEYLDQALIRGKGVYVLSLHLGNGDTAATALALKGYKISLISKYFKNRLLNTIWFHFRSAKGVKYIEAHSEKTAFEILRAVRTQSLVVFVLDQFMGKPFGIQSLFFGKKTGTAYGLALFYLKTRTPVVPIYGFEAEDGKLHVVCEPALDLESLLTSDQDRNILTLTQRFCDVIEAAVRKHPRDWMWVHRRWKEFE
jgi:KDO2-lipid IV(A) lauroyltransferase